MQHTQCQKLIGKDCMEICIRKNGRKKRENNVLNGGELFWIVNRKGKYQNLKVGGLLQWEL